MRKPVKTQYQSGFTFIELLTAILIIAVISAIAIPSYLNYMQRTDRVQALNALRLIQLTQEQYRQNNTTYGTIADIAFPVTTDNGFYTLTINNPTATGYTAVATAGGRQVNDAEGGIACSVLTLTVANGLDTVDPPECW